MYDAILAVLLTLPAWHGDRETPEQREQRMGVVAQAIETAALQTPWAGPPEQLAALLVVQGWSESRFARHVHAGQCRPQECDRGRAATPWQLQHGSWLPREQWQMMQGIDLPSTTLAARAAATLLSRARNQCGSVKGAVSLYATGSTCSWPEAQPRVRWWQKLYAQLKGGS